MLIKSDIRYRYLGVICVCNILFSFRFCADSDKCYSQQSIEYFTKRVIKQENIQRSLDSKLSVPSTFSASRILGTFRDPYYPTGHDTEMNIKSEECKRRRLSNKTSQPSVLANFGNGRLGNQMCNFATQYALNKEYGVLSYFGGLSLKILGITFNLPQRNQRNSTFHIWNATCANPSELDWKLVRNLELVNTRLRESIFQKIRYSNYIKLEAYVCDIKGFFPHLQDLRRQVFRFYEEDMKQAKLIEKKIRSTKKNSVFVSVHIRLTDMKSQLTNSFNLTVASEPYFENAMHFMKEKFGENVVFAVCSDDITSARTLFSKTAQSKFDIIFPSIDKIPRASSITLALLSLADHSILTYSTFGLWGALLRKTNGEMIMPQEMSKTDTGYYALNANIPNLKLL